MCMYVCIYSVRVLVPVQGAHNEGVYVRTHTV